jgi:hypothetical protein
VGKEDKGDMKVGVVVVVVVKRQGSITSNTLNPGASLSFLKGSIVYCYCGVGLQYK